MKGEVSRELARKNVRRGSRHSQGQPGGVRDCTKLTSLKITPTRLSSFRPNSTLTHHQAAASGLARRLLTASGPSEAAWAQPLQWPWATEAAAKAAAKAEVMPLRALPAWREACAACQSLAGHELAVVVRLHVPLHHCQPHRRLLGRVEEAGQRVLLALHAASTAIAGDLQPRLVLALHLDDVHKACLAPRRPLQLQISPVLLGNRLTDSCRLATGHCTGRDAELSSVGRKSYLRFY